MCMLMCVFVLCVSVCPSQKSVADLVLDAHSHSLQLTGTMATERSSQPSRRCSQGMLCVCVCMHAHSSYHLLRWVSRTCLSCQLLIMHVVLGLVRAHSLLQSCCTRPNVYVYESEHICISVHSDVVFSSIT